MKTDLNRLCNTQIILQCDHNKIYSVESYMLKWIKEPTVDRLQNYETIPQNGSKPFNVYQIISSKLPQTFHNFSFQTEMEQGLSTCISPSEVTYINYQIKWPNECITQHFRPSEKRFSCLFQKKGMKMFERKKKEYANIWTNIRLKTLSRCARIQHRK